MGGGPQDAVPCEECGGKTVGPFVVTSTDYGRIGLWPAGRRRVVARNVSALHASVCVGCGGVRLSAADRAAVRRMADEHPEWFE